MHDDDERNDGFRYYYPVASLDSAWQAAYGLLLISLNEEADRLTELTGHFVEVDYPTEEEFRAMRRRGMYAIKRDRTTHSTYITVRGLCGKK